MGLFSRILGNADEVNLEAINEEFAPILADDESIQIGYKVIRDLFIFTNKRIILIDKQGLTAKKVEYLSIPYRSITCFCIETNGHFDLDSELKIWISGRENPITKELKRGTDIVGIQKTIANFVF
ncbi:PH domain-containing protein [Aliikangiella sp. IMCC44359]|uniref:PH domain-containing protein n=1 Tax=Aliikangiella sp. IMCC44359 TaxID=3459125 RepID=UPI00403B2440